MAKPSVWDERRISDPQGAIDDLIKQTSKQAKAIHDLNLEVKRLQEIIDKTKVVNDE